MLQKLEQKFREYFPKHTRHKNTYINSIKGKSGIEIGGPSPIFSDKGLLPIYKHIHNLDVCNYSSNTVWEGKIQKGRLYNFHPKKNTGYQFICEGNRLTEIQDNTYDFVLSSHNLEHFANPMSALKEWRRITKKSGHLILVLPNKEKTFDHRRPVTTLEHLIEDFNNNTEENDETHFEEILQLHDIQIDMGLKDAVELQDRIKKNFENRCAHHHVFDQDLTVKMLKAAGLEVKLISSEQIHIICLAQFGAK